MGPTSAFFSIPRLRATASIIVLAAGLGVCAAAQGRPEGPSSAAIDKAIEKGVAWLLKAQEIDGSWRGPQPEQYHGMTALTVYTLLKCDLPATHPALRAGLACMKSWPVERTYDLGCVLMTWMAYGDSRPQKDIKTFADRIAKQIGNGNEKIGPRWGYPRSHDGTDLNWTDLSNTQYAVLGLRAARLSGYKTGSPTFWINIAEDLLDQQHSYGGWGYRKGDRPSASMTVAGMTVLVICAESLGERIPLDLKHKIETGVNKGVMWLDQHWAVDRMVDLHVQGDYNDRWLYYYLYALERFGSFTEREQIGPHWWYPEGATAIVKAQKGDGSWGWGDDDTCFALLFLRRASRVSGGKVASAGKAAADDPASAAAAFTIGTDRANPLSAWIRVLGDAVKTPLAAGRKVKTVEWLIDDAVVANLPFAADADVMTPASSLRYTVTRNGKQKLRARIEVAGPDGAGSDWFESNVLELDVSDAEEPWHREAIRDAGLNLLTRARASASASSMLGPDRAAEMAIDGQFGTSWLPTREDTAPWIQLAMRPGIRVNCIKLTSASPYSEGYSDWARPKDVEIRINQDPPLTMQLDDTVRRKQRLAFPTRVVTSIRVKILNVYPGSREGTLAGFKAIEAFLEEGAPEGTAGAPPANVVAAVPRETILPVARVSVVPWKYTTDEPAPDWYAEGFEDGAWKSGPAGFGNQTTPYCPVRTDWKTTEIWIRRDFTLPKGDPGEIRVALGHDDDADVYINGVLAVRSPGYSLGGYFDLPINEAARAVLKPGRNIVAAHCTNTGGRAYLDVGIVRVLPADKKK